MLKTESKNIKIEFLTIQKRVNARFLISNNLESAPPGAQLELKNPLGYIKKEKVLFLMIHQVQDIKYYDMMMMKMKILIMNIHG